MILRFAADGLSPWWVTRGAQVHSYLFQMQHSRAHFRYDSLSLQRALYRLALGQPNQEDFLRTLANAAPTRQAQLARLTF